MMNTSNETGRQALVIREGDEEVWILRLNRPERLNSLDPEAINVLRERLVEFREDSAARVCILTGTGTRGFCTGADLKATLPPSLPFAAAAFQPDSSAVAAGNYIRGLDINRLDIRKPIIAAVNGHAVGGGMEIALACDIRIASSNATFGLPEVKVGSIPAVGGIQWLMRSVGHSRAMTMILSGESIDAATAEKIGLVSAVHTSEELLPKAIELAKTIASNAPLAVRAARLLAREGLNMTVSQAMLLEQFVWGTLRDTEDRVEGRRAFAEKRKPVYCGR